jgi:hypothetical protein
MRSKGTLILDPIYTAGTISFVQNNNSATMSTPPSFSMVGFRLKSMDSPEVYIVSAHTAGNPALTLDTVYVGPTNVAAAYQSMHVEYALANNVSAIISPVFGFTDNPRIYGLAPERMDELFPLSRLQPGIPMAFALSSPQSVRFSHGGRSDGRSMRFEYRFRPQVEDLTYDVASIPLVPIEFRHTLADMVLVYLYTDKNDDRLTVVGTSVRSALGAMAQENDRRLVKMDQYSGYIFPRAGGNPRIQNRLLRTESGLIIR